MSPLTLHGDKRNVLSGLISDIPFTATDCLKIRMLTTLTCAQTECFHCIHLSGEMLSIVCTDVYFGNIRFHC